MPRTVVDVFEQRLRGTPRRRTSTSDMEACPGCGSLHRAVECPDLNEASLASDAVDLSTRPANGEYAGPLEVKVIPPGFSFLSRYAGARLPAVDVGQMWYSPDCLPFLVRSVRGQQVTLRRHRRRISYGTVIVRLSTLRARWTYAGVARG